MDCTSTNAIESKGTEHMFPHKTSTQVLEFSLSDYVDIKAEGAVGKKDHCGTTSCKITTIQSDGKCAASPTGDFYYETDGGVNQAMKIKPTAAKET